MGSVRRDFSARDLAILTAAVLAVAYAAMMIWLFL